jgi:hypothetical protein
MDCFQLCVEPSNKGPAAPMIGKTRSREYRNPQAIRYLSLPPTRVHIHLMPPGQTDLSRSQEISLQAAEGKILKQAESKSCFFSHMPSFPDL